MAMIVCEKYHPDKHHQLRSKRLSISGSHNDIIGKFPLKDCNGKYFVGEFHPCVSFNSVTGISRAGLDMFQCGNSLRVHYTFHCDGKIFHSNMFVLLDIFYVFLCIDGNIKSCLGADRNMKLCIEADRNMNSCIGTDIET